MLSKATNNETLVFDFKGSTHAYLERTSIQVSRYLYPLFYQLMIKVVSQPSPPAIANLYHTQSLDYDESAFLQVCVGYSQAVAGANRVLARVFRPFRHAARYSLSSPPKAVGGSTS